MGGGRWTDSDWKTYSSSHTKGKHVDEIYDSRGIDKDLNPKGVKIRESRDSKDNPLSNAIIVALDVTGSMDPVLDDMAKNGLNTLFKEIYDRKPVTDPHVMLMGIGDVEVDRAPIQVTQFEADIRIAKQLKKVFFERGGGGNSYESYILPWYFAANHTSIDCFEKRGKRGYLFTVGDEGPTPKISRSYVQEFLGDKVTKDLTAENLLDDASKMYDVYHIMVEEGNHFRRYGEEVVKLWTKLLGQRAIRLKDHTKLSEVIVSTIQVNEGIDKKTIIGSWKGATAAIVKEAIKDLTFDKPADAVVRF